MLEVLENIMKSLLFYSYIHVASIMHYCISRWERAVVGVSAIHMQTQRDEPGSRKALLAMRRLRPGKINEMRDSSCVHNI